MFKLSLQMKRNIFHYRTGTLLNQKHAVRSKMSTSLQCPLCRQADSTLHILSGCRRTIISVMITERHNVACRLIMKGTLAGCLVHLNAGSTNRLAQQNLQIPENVNNRTIPSWLFGARLSARDRLTSSRPYAILVTPLPTKKSKSPTTPHLHQVSQPRQSSRDVRRVHELNVNMREMRYTMLRLSTVKIHGLDTRGL